MFKKRIISVVSSVLAIWYLLCVAGFDVHTCSHSGRSFVAPLVMGVSCDDIHPESGCDNDSCLDGHHGFCGHKCCTDDIRILLLTGDSRIGGGMHHHHHHCECMCGHCPILADKSMQNNLSVGTGASGTLPDFSFKDISPDNIFSVFSVWRI